MELLSSLMLKGIMQMFKGIQSGRKESEPLWQVPITLLDPTSIRGQVSIQATTTHLCVMYLHMTNTYKQC